MVTIELKGGDDCELTLEVESDNSEDVIICCQDPADEDVSLFIAKGQARKLVAFAEALKKYHLSPKDFKSVNKRHEPLQARTARRVRETFGEGSLMNRRERCMRFIEEAVEFVQALDFEKEDVLKMVEYVYSRDRGEPNQELGGAMVTTLALAECVKLDAYDELHRELDRLFAKQDEVRAKNQQKIDGGFAG